MACSLAYLLIVQVRYAAKRMIVIAWASEFNSYNTSIFSRSAQYD